MKRVVFLLGLAALALAGCKKDQPAKPAASTPGGESARSPDRDVPAPRRKQPMRDVPADPDQRDFDRGDDGDDDRKSKRMAQFDADGDGQLSQAERDALKADRDARRAERDAERAARTAKFDKDGDGKLGDDERQAMRDERLDEMMSELDANGDGKLSPEEMEASGRMQGMFAPNADTDGDGALSREEIDAAMRQRGPEGGWRSRRGGPQGDLPPQLDDQGGGTSGGGGGLPSGNNNNDTGTGRVDRPSDVPTKR